MSPERLKKVEEIYHAVLEFPPEKRDSFLQEVCENDIELRNEIESLLSYEENFDSLIDSHPKSLVEEIFTAKKQETITGKKINQYKIESKIGEGGMGAVYLAKDTKLERKVAIKFLSEEFSQESSRRNRFFQEAKSASALNHPNILTVHEISEFEGTHFIVTEYIKGKTLSKFLAEERPTLQQVLDIAIQISSALTSAHEAGIIHRDIKPDNVMVRNDGFVKVLDFGIAKLSENSLPPVDSQIDEETPTAIKPPTTMPGMIIGTPQYMSPEQARGLKIDFRSDIFSFGVLLYEMIAGKPPFSGATKMDVIGSILKDEPIPLKEYQSEIPESLEHIVEKTLRKDREQRYQHIKDLYIDLKDIKKTIEFDTKLVHRTNFAKAATTINTTSGIVTQRRFSIVHLLLFFVIIGLAGSIIWWFLPKSGNNIEQLKTAEVVSWASKPGEVYSVGTFSPDGKMVAFTSTKSGTKNIWIKQTNSGEAIEITKDEFQNENPIWSPNGEELAFFSARGKRAGFWRIPVLGGSPKLIAEIEDGSSLLRYWSKNDLIYYESQFELYAINAKTGESKKVTDFANNKIEARSINISNDEQNLIFTTFEGNQSNLWTKRIDEQTPKKILTSNGDLRNTVWHPDNYQIFFSQSVDDTFQIFVTDIKANTPRQISNAERDCFVLTVSSDGTKILYGSAKEESDIWGFNIKENKEFTVASDIDSELWANVSPDGKTIAYQSIKNLSQGNKLFQGKILTESINSQSQPINISAIGGLPIWSPNGNYLAYLKYQDNKNLIEIAKNDGGQKKIVANDVGAVSFTLLPYNRIQTNDFTWSPDSKTIAYLSNKSGQSNIWLANADGSGEVQLTDNQDKKLYLNCPIWSADGKQILYSTKTGITSSEGRPTFQIWLIDIETKKTTQLTQPGEFLRLVGWEKESDEVLFINIAGSEMTGLQPEITLNRLNVKSGKIKQAAKLKDTYTYNIQLSPDGRNIAFVAHREDKDNLWLIPANGGEEKKLTTNNDSRLYFSSMAWSPDSNSIYYGKQSRYSLLSMLTNFK